MIMLKNKSKLDLFKKVNLCVPKVFKDKKYENMGYVYKNMRDVFFKNYVYNTLKYNKLFYISVG